MLYIKLEESDPLVWRRIVVPANYTFYQLHMAIQGAFGWENSHLFQFSEKGMLDPVNYGEVFDNIDNDFKTVNARKTKMAKVFKKEGQSYVYIYDFGDHWLHRITLEKIEDKEMAGPYCLDGGGACPPEDVGSMYGYKEMVEILKQKSHPEYKSYMVWLDLPPGEKWDAAFFSKRETNKRLALL